MRACGGLSAPVFFQCAAALLSLAVGSESFAKDAPRGKRLYLDAARSQGLTRLATGYGTNVQRR
jgi:hypothetical protein